jgi:hypothetical protein
MIKTSCQVTFIYALYHNGVPFYIGQSVCPKQRLSHHINGRSSKVSRHIQSLYKQGYTKKDIKQKILKCCAKIEADYWEMRYINHCITKGLDIKNNCRLAESVRSKIKFHR